MGFFDKIKRMFIREASPLPSDGEFYNSSVDFDADKIIRELGLSDKVVDEKTDKNPADSSKSGSRKGHSGVLISELFIDDEDPIDVEGLKAMTRKDESGAKDQETSAEDKGPTEKTDARPGDNKMDTIRKTVSDKSAELKGKMDELLDDVEQKSGELDEIERKEKESASRPLEYRGKSLLDDKDDFFSKAEAYAEGRPLPPTGMEFSQSEEESGAKPTEDKRKVYGFEDLDKDGDELIDNAVIEEE